MMAVMDVDLLLGIEQALLLPLIILFYARCSCHQLQVCVGRSPFISRAGGSNLGLVGQNAHCRRQCVEARSADQSSTRSAKFFFQGHFSVAWMGSRSTFVLCTALPLLSGFLAIRDRLTLDVERKCTLRW